MTAKEALEISKSMDISENVMNRIFKKIKEVAEFGGERLALPWIDYNKHDIVKAKLEELGYSITYEGFGLIMVVVWR